ncbi:MAG: glycosyltransferase family 2 protein [Candidatus Falkowbacteria bacterium]|nr:glycosyltransferase family 2 protein [Candidatus Falkowbacteria bacterium]
MFDLKFSVLLPTYNGAKVIEETLKSLLSQGFDNFEVIVQDDASKDNIEEIIKAVNDKRILFYKNTANLGYPKNLESLRKKASGDIIFLLGQDDILATGALMNTYKAFKISEDIGAVTRPYYWFDKDVRIPVRAKGQLNKDKDEVVNITDEAGRVIKVFQTLDQLSGLALRKKYIDLPFHPDIFPCHVYPFASIFKKYPIVFLKDYNLAVRISSSQTRLISSIYDKSPIQSWKDMFVSVFYEPEFKKIREECIRNFVAVNYVGLVQIRNYAKFRYLLRETWYLVKYRWQNIFSLQFWFFSLGCLIMPSSLLIPLVDWYKEKINSRRLKGKAQCVSLS